MKYIDADKLIAEIERRMEMHRKASASGYIIDPNRLDEDEDIISLITSLQQEQPDGYNRAMLEVKSEVDKLYDETGIGLNEYDSGLYNGIIKTCMALRGFIKARISSQEQPELEEELVNYFGAMPDDKDKIAVARHFYELGLNARNED